VRDRPLQRRNLVGSPHQSRSASIRLLAWILYSEPVSQSLLLRDFGALDIYLVRGLSTSSCRSSTLHETLHRDLYQLSLILVRSFARSCEASKCSPLVSGCLLVLASTLLDCSSSGEPVLYHTRCNHSISKSFLRPALKIHKYFSQWYRQTLRHLYKLSYYMAELDRIVVFAYMQ